MLQFKKLYTAYYSFTVGVLVIYALLMVTKTVTCLRRTFCPKKSNQRGSKGDKKSARGNQEGEQRDVQGDYEYADIE